METATEIVVAVSIVPREQVYAYLPDILPLIESAVDASEGLHTMETVEEWINTGQLDVWVAVNETGLVGCFLTEVIPVAKGLDLNVPYAGFKKNFKALNDSMKELLRVSEESGYRSVRYISSDKRFGAFAKKHGLRRRFVEYVKEF